MIRDSSFAALTCLLFLTLWARMQISHPTPHFASSLTLTSGKIAPASISAGFAEPPAWQRGLSPRPACEVSPHHSPKARPTAPLQGTTVAHISPGTAEQPLLQCHPSLDPCASGQQSRRQEARSCAAVPRSGSKEINAVLLAQVSQTLSHQSSL